MAGGKREGAGRKKGALNKSSEQAKLLLTEFVGNNMEDLQTLFDNVKHDNPQKAFDLLIGSLEFVVPKLSRVDSTNELSGKVDLNSTVEFIGGKLSDSD